MIVDTAEIWIKHEISLFFFFCLFCFWLSCRTHTRSLCGQEGSGSQRDTRCNKYGGAKECWFLLLLWEWHPQLCFFQTWWWKIRVENTPASIKTLEAQQLLRTSVPVYCGVWMVGWFISSNLWWRPLKKISSVYKVCCQLSSSDLDFFFFLLLSDLQFIHPMRRCAKHTAMSLLREFQLPLEPSVWVNKWKK